MTTLITIYIAGVVFELAMLLLAKLSNDGGKMEMNTFMLYCISSLLSWLLFAWQIYYLFTRKK